MPREVHSDPGGSSRREAIERCLQRATDPDGSGALAFVTLWETAARNAASGFDTLASAGYVMPLNGMAVSVKDLLDVAGEVTHAAARPLDDAPPARQDAPVVARLKRAGAVLIGRTTMAPFAYSAVGLNPQFGTPGNPADPTRTPGGSSSGAAVSVAAEMAAAAIGSDTVGSIRVPAALCGIVGFKPTQRHVCRRGAVPLSHTLDTIGPLARSVEVCARVFAAIAEEPVPSPKRTGIVGLRLALPNAGFLGSTAPSRRPSIAL